jgi:hypothetical protein
MYAIVSLGLSLVECNFSQASLRPDVVTDLKQTLSWKRIQSVSIAGETKTKGMRLFHPETLVQRYRNT